MKLQLKDLPVEGKKVLMRVDFNVPLDGSRNVLDTTRIVAALPSIESVLSRGGALILMSHLGRPRNAPDPALSLKPIVPLLEALIKRPVQMAPDCIGEAVEDQAAQLKPGEVLLLENLRFHRAETHPEEDLEFAKKLAQLGDVYVNDAFGTAHRKHSSTYAIAHHFPGKAAAGFLLEKEIRFLGETLANPERPFYAILGGAKISTKIGVVKRLLDRADRVLIGGGMTYTFLKAKGIDVGNSPIEEEFLPLAKELISERLVLPLDSVVAKECNEEAETQVIEYGSEGIPEGYEGFDIGPKTIEYYSSSWGKAKTVLWNGPVGVYELDRFAHGTAALAARIGELDCVSIIGGGDLIAAVNRAGVSEKITHISTGGGATLEYLEQGTLPAIEALTSS